MHASHPHVLPHKKKKGSKREKEVEEKPTSPGPGSLFGWTSTLSTFEAVGTVSKHLPNRPVLHAAEEGGDRTM